MSTGPSIAVNLRAINLVGKWQKVRSGHVTLNGLSCACNLGSGSLSATAFEQPFLDYMHDLHAGTPTVDGLFGQCAYVEGEAGDLHVFLLALAQLSSFGPAELSVLTDAECSIKSFAENHLFADTGA